MDVLGMWYCRRDYRKVAVLGCLKCKSFGRCEQMTDEVLCALERSEYVTISSDSRLMPRRVKMFLFINANGTVTQAPADFDVKNPDWEMLKEVNEVLQISTVYTKQLKLVPKTKEERDKIVRAATPAPNEAQAPKRGTRRRG